MNLVGAIISTIVIGIAGPFATMAVIFSGGGMVSNDRYKSLIPIMDALIYLTPILSGLSVAMIWIAYNKEWGSYHYFWTAIPFVIFVFILMAPSYK